MLLATLLSVCVITPDIVDYVIQMRETHGIEEAQLRESIRALNMEPAFKSRTFAAINLVYALPKHSDYSTVKLQLTLTCDNEETIRGYKHSNEGARRGKGSRKGYEFYRKYGPGETWP